MGVTRGTGVVTALSIISGRGLTSGVTYFFSSRPKPRSALCRRNVASLQRRLTILAQGFKRLHRLDAVDDAFAVLSP